VHSNLRDLEAVAPVAAFPAAGLALDTKRATMKASAGDVRPLCLRPVCGKLGNEQKMVKVGPMRSPAHDRCAFAQLGREY
jgi:hypothetical protein